MVDHFSKKHKVAVTTDTIWNFAQGEIKQT